MSVALPSKIEEPQRPSEARLTGQNIICFAKDWNEDPTSCNHVLNELAKENKILWLNSISTRSPNLTNSRDVGKIFRKIGGFLKGPKQVGERMWVYTPLVLPLHHSAFAVKVNRLWLRLNLKWLARRLGMSDYILWSFVHTAAEYAGHLDEKLLVYYCTDNWRSFRGMQREAVDRMVDELSRKADIVFATANSLTERLRPNNAETYLAPHGVNYEEFSKALLPETRLPDDIAALPQPVIGYYGLVEDWLDFDLLSWLAKRHPEWSIVLIGAKRTDTSALEGIPNIHFLGRKPHSELPNYCKAMQVGLIPHKVNDLTQHMNPIKLREYMCAGLPIVATALPEVAYYGDFCSVARSYEAFEQGIEHALRTETRATRQRRSEAMQTETWEHRVADISRRIEGIRRKKRQ